MSFILINDQFLPAKTAFISTQERGFRFGDGVFETIKLCESVPHQWEFHLNRLQNGLNALKISYDTARLQALCRQLIHKNAQANGILRIYISRGQGSRGYLPADNITPLLVVETSDMPVIPPHKTAAWSSAYEKISSRALPSHIKHAQGLNSTLARMEAFHEHCAEALLLNVQGEICEGSSSNIFWYKQDTLYTPSLECGVLPGATRHAILRLSPWKIEEGKYALDELQHAEAVILTNSVWGVKPLYALKPQNWQWNSTSIAEKLQALLEADQLTYTHQNRAAWQL